MQFLSLLLVLLLAGIFPMDLKAQADEEIFQLSNLSLESLMRVNIATKTPHFKKDITSTVHIFNASEIKKHGWLYLSELLRHVPGVDLVDMGSGIFFSVRGVADLSTHGNKTVIMIDGHNTQFSTFNSSNYLGFQNDINLAAAKSVEVQVGPAGTLHGANAFGLVVDILTYEPGDIEGATVSFSAGTDQEYIPSLTWGSTRGKWSGFLSGTYWGKETENLSEIQISTTPGYQYYNNSTFQDNGLHNSSGDGYLDFNKEIRLGFHFMHNHNGFGTLLLSTETGNQTSYKDMIFLDINHKFSDRFDYKLKSNYLSSVIDSENTERIITSNNTHGSVNAGGHSTIFDNQFIFSQNNSNVWLTGLYYEASRQRPAQTTIGTLSAPTVIPIPIEEGNWDNYASYLQWEWEPLSNLNTVTGVRYVNSLEQYSNAVLPHFGLKYLFPEDLSLKLNYQKGYRTPSPTEMGAVASFITPNPGLESEFIDSYELIISEQSKVDHMFWLTYFYSQVSNLIVLVNVTASTSSYQNVDTMIARGFELGSRYILRENLSLDGNFTYTESFYSGTNANTQTIIPYKVNLSINWVPYSQWSITFDNYLRIDPRTKPSNPIYAGNNAPSWLLSNLTMAIHNVFSVPKLSATVAIRNLFDEEYGLDNNRSGTGLVSIHPQERRNAIATLEYRFK